MKKSSTLFCISAAGLCAALICLAFPNQVFSESTNTVSATAAAIASDKAIVGNGKIASKNIAVKPFNQIIINGAFDITLQHGKKENITVTTDSNILPYFNASVIDNKLTIDMEKGVVTSPTQIKLIITTKPLHKITLSGKNNLIATKLKTSYLTLNIGGKNSVNLQGSIKNFNLNLDGDSQLQATVYNANDVKVKSGGNTNIDLAGSTKVLHITTAGKVIVSANNLIANDVTVHSYGDSDITVNALKALNIKTAGKSTVKYYGDPVIEKNVYGEAAVKKMEKT